MASTLVRRRTQHADTPTAPAARMALSPKCIRAALNTADNHSIALTRISQHVRHSMRE